MNRIKTEHALHNGQAVVKLIFGYDATLLAELRKRLPTVRWSRTMRCWWLPVTLEHLAALKQLGIDTRLLRRTKPINQGILRTKTPDKRYM